MISEEKKSPQSAVKGVRTMRPARAGDRALAVALHYGFTPIKAPTITRDDLHKTRLILGEEARRGESGAVALVPEEKVALVRHYMENGFEEKPQPILLFFRAGNRSAGKRTRGDGRANLEIMGTAKSIAEAILIKTAAEILKEEGRDGIFVHINSIGDRESTNRLGRELSLYYRKHLAELHAPCRQALKRDVFELFRCENEECRALMEEAPKAIGCLSEESRQHFREVLEYLETLGIPYKIHHRLVGVKPIASHTLFEIRTAEDDAEGELLALGLRYNGLARELGWKRDLAGIGVSLLSHPPTRRSRRSERTQERKPKFYFIQLGFEAKLRSLAVIELLRQARIPIYQALAHDQLSSQLGAAESMKVPYTIIMGIKEALEGNVIVRNMFDRSQETVPIEELPRYLGAIA